MTKFAIEMERRATHDVGSAPIAVSAAGHVLTRLIREGMTDSDRWIEASPVALAFWLTDNWWRLRWEAVPTSGIGADWRLAHEMSSIGGGYAWPRLSIWGSGEQVGVSSRSDPQGVTGPVRYLVDALLFVPASDFERGVDEFLSAVLSDGARTDTNLSSLRSQVEALHAERQDTEVAKWRRVEARLGYDPDEAPEDTIKALDELARQFGRHGVEESIAAAPGADAASILANGIEAARSSRITCDVSHTLKLCAPLKGKLVERPWKLAEGMARRLRRLLKLGEGPVRNSDLSDVLGVTSSTLSSQGSSRDVPYSLRLGQPALGKMRVALRDSFPLDRRFDLVRILGDAIWVRQDMLGPVAASNTDRQMFQRAFAQAILCPFESLRAFLSGNRVSDGAISAAAQHFQVSERVVRTLLVNKNVIPRSNIMPPAWRDYGSEQFSDLVEAA